MITTSLDEADPPGKKAFGEKLPSWLPTIDGRLRTDGMDFVPWRWPRMDLVIYVTTYHPLASCMCRRSIIYWYMRLLYRLLYSEWVWPTYINPIPFSQPDRSSDDLWDIYTESGRLSKGTPSVHTATRTENRAERKLVAECSYQPPAIHIETDERKWSSCRTWKDAMQLNAQFFAGMLEVSIDSSSNPMDIENETLCTYSWITSTWFITIHVDWAKALHWTAKFLSPNKWDPAASCYPTTANCSYHWWLPYLATTAIYSCVIRGGCWFPPRILSAIPTAIREFKM